MSAGRGAAGLAARASLQCLRAFSCCLWFRPVPSCVRWAEVKLDTGQGLPWWFLLQKVASSLLRWLGGDGSPLAFGPPPLLHTCVHPPPSFESADPDLTSTIIGVGTPRIGEVGGLVDLLHPHMFT